MGQLFQFFKAKEDTYDTLLEKAQNGDEEARELLIRKYTPFILKVLSQKSGRFLRLGEDDEVSIGLLAFNEAISHYEQGKGSFFSFAETVIQRRLIDYYRKESRNNKVIPLSALENEDQEGQELSSLLTAKQAVAEFHAKSEARDRQEEIKAYAVVLQEFGISFTELVSISPKHDDARIRAMEAAYLVAESEDLRLHLLHKRELPLKVLTDLVDVSRKTLERQRKYIIAVALILIYDFSHLKGYIRGF